MGEPPGEDCVVVAVAESGSRPRVDGGRPAACGELVQHAAQGVNVSSRSRGIESGCLGREIARRPPWGCVARSAALDADLAGYRGRAEIGKPRVDSMVGVRGKQDVLRL